MNQGNGNQVNGNVNPAPVQATTNVSPQPMPATPAVNVNPQPVQAVASNTTPQPAAVNSSAPDGLNFAQAPSFTAAPVEKVSQPVQSAPVSQPVAPQAPQTQSVVAPTQTVINTKKKKGGNIFLFLVIILIGLFIYYIDDVLAYFNQGNTPVAESGIKENASANLIDGYIKVDEENSYIKLKSIKFYNFKKSSDDTVVFSYTSDRTYSNVANLGILIEFYDEYKNLVSSDIFNVFGTVESGITRQYKIPLDVSAYDRVFYALVKEKTVEETKVEENQTEESNISEVPSTSETQVKTDETTTIENTNKESSEGNNNG